MDSLLLDAARKLEKIGTPSGKLFAFAQGVRQFNALLRDAQAQLPQRQDILALGQFEDAEHVICEEYRDSVQRLRVALELRPLSGATAFLADISVRDTHTEALTRDIAELRDAAAAGLVKTTMLLSGLVAEALLLSRHPDKSNYGPGLADLVKQAGAQELFGRDTQRQLETLVDYRNLIHPRAEVRNKTEPDRGRAEAALVALRMLWEELERNPRLRFG